jgi:hypothetical protein
MGPQLRTFETLAELRDVEWFSHVGVHDTDAADVLSSWQEAVESSESLEWENLCLEAVNQYHARIREQYPEQLAQWNARVEIVRPLSRSLVQIKTQKVVQENNLPRAFISTVDWDILHVCMEAEYADVQPPGFYASQAYWYVKGHFPCGWRGDFPAGRLVIF